MNTNMTIVILAGGKGRRLWPVSRRDLPKQFIDFFGTGETLLQTSASRASRIVGKDNVIIVTNAEYESVVRSQLEWLPDSHLLLEPVHRNTAPSTAWATHRVMIEKGDDAIVAIMPADQLILHEDRFETALSLGADFVGKHDDVLIMGATPTRTEPGYGYIQVSQDHTNEMIYNVRSFIEKPDRDMAKMLIESGEFLWNTGIYMSRVGHLRDEMKKLLPIVLRDVRGDAEEERQFVARNYSRYPNLSLDLAILEKMEDRSVMHCDFGWADIGTWHGIYEAVHHDGNDNVMVNSQSHLIADNSTNNVVYAPDGKLIVMSGMEGYIVAEKGDVLLICPKQDSSAMVRKYLGKVENDADMERYY